MFPLHDGVEINGGNMSQALIARLLRVSGRTCAGVTHADRAHATRAHGPAWVDPRRHLRRDSPQIIPEFDSCMESLKNEVYSRINSMVDTPANKK